MSTPRFFVAHPASEHDDDVVFGEPQDVEQILGVVALHSRLHGAGEYVIGRDMQGRVGLYPQEERARFNRRVQAALAYHDVATQARPVRIDVESFYVLCVELVEQAPDAPGLNDPLYVYGELSGPFPRALGSPPERVRGQLTIARRDLLWGFVLGRHMSFRVESVQGVQGESRFVGALVGAEPADALSQGRGVVLAVPVLPADMALGPSGNEALVAGILSDVIHATRADVQASAPHHDFAKRTLPVADRAAAEAALESEGFVLDGDRAVRTSSGKVAATLQKAFGLAETRQVPREASLDELLSLAQETATVIDPASSPSVAALHALACTHVGAPLQPEAAPVRQAATQPARATPAPRPKVSTPRDEWMKDFVAAHRTPGAPKPKLTSTRKLAPNSKQTRPTVSNSDASPGKPDWMKDFE